MSKTVAIAGINGFLGKPVLEALLEPTFRGNFKLPIRAVTRKVTEPSTAEVEYHEASDLESYEKAFQGVDVVIDLRSTSALGTNDLALAAKNANVKVLVPSEFGLDYAKAGKYKPGFKGKVDIVNFAEKAGLKVIQFKVGYFIDSTLSPWGDRILFYSVKDRTSDYAGDGSIKISFNSIKNIGQSVAAVLSRPFDELPDVVRIAGDSISPREFVDLYAKHTGNKLTVNPTTIEEIDAAGDDALAKPGREKVFQLLRATTVVSSEASNFSLSNDNEFVNPGEKYFKWEKVEEYIPKLLA